MNEPWLLLVVGGVVGLLLVALVGLIALFVQVRRLPALQQQLDARLQGRMDQLARDLATFRQGSIRMGEELTALRQQVKRLEGKQLKLEQQDPQAMPYNQAARLVGMGASIEDLTQSCGLSKAEAELFVKLHASRQG